MLQFGKNLRQRARELKLTDAEVARRSGINERRYGFYVTGEREPDLATLMRMATTLQSSVDDLLAQGGTSRGAPTRIEILKSAASELSPPHFDLLVNVAQTFAQHERRSRPKRSKS